MLTDERIRELWENYSPTQGIESFARAVEAAALESQSSEIAALKEQEAQLCTLYGLAQAECKRLRKDAERLDCIEEKAWSPNPAHDYGRLAWNLELPTIDGVQSCSLRAAIDAAVAKKGGES